MEMNLQNETNLEVGTWEKEDIISLHNLSMILAPSVVMATISSQVEVSF